MINQEYSIAISETLDILNHTKKEDVDKIPNKFLDFLKEHASKTYISTIDFTKSLKEMNLKPKTIGILSIINKKFWCNDEQRKSFETKLKQNETMYQNEIKEKYNPDNLFQKKNNIDCNNSENVTALVEIKEKTLFQKIFDKIKKLFTRK